MDEKSARSPTTLDLRLTLNSLTQSVSNQG